MDQKSVLESESPPPEDSTVQNFTSEAPGGSTTESTNTSGSLDESIPKRTRTEDLVTPDDIATALSPQHIHDTEGRRLSLYTDEDGSLAVKLPAVLEEDSSTDSLNYEPLDGSTSETTIVTIEESGTENSEAAAEEDSSAEPPKTGINTASSSMPAINTQFSNRDSSTAHDDTTVMPESSSTDNAHRGDKKNAVSHNESSDIPQGIITVTRPVYTLEECNRAFLLEDGRGDQNDIKTKLKRYAARNCQCSGKCFSSALMSFFPFLGMLRSYQWKRWLPPDIISGLCVGVVHIPQGMGFALLTSLPPVTGLYTSFFPALVYFFFGTSNHLSMGTMALMSIMAGSVVDREVAMIDFEPVIMNNTNENNTDSNLPVYDDYVQAKIGIAVSLTLMMGMFQLLMGVLRLGVIATFMSMPFIGSFLTGSAVVIVVSQLPALLDLKVPRHSGLFSTPLRFYEVCKHLPETNVAAIVTGIVCLAVLIVVKEVINERFRKKLKIPIPSELLVVIVATLVSHFAEFETRFDVSVVSKIQQGFPTPAVPPMINFENYIIDAFVIALISFTISIAMAKLMARKHRYPINTNQEMLAYGIMHTVSSFFYCFATAQAPPRTLVHDGAGGKTQMHALVSCLVVLLVMLAVGPLFYSLPITTLAAIIICALIPLLRQFKEIPFLWKVNKWDLAVWLVTFLGTVVLSIILGLAIGIGFSALTIVLQTHLADGTILRRLKNTEYFIPEKCTAFTAPEKKVHTPGIRTFRFNAPLMYTNVESFRNQLYTKIYDPSNKQWVFESQVDTPKPRMNLMKRLSTEFMMRFKQKRSRSIFVQEINISQSDSRLTSIATKELPDGMFKPNGLSNISNGHARGSHAKENATSLIPPEKLHAIIMDCSCITFIDIMGLTTLKSIHSDYDNVDISFVLAACSQQVINRLNAAGMLAKFKIFPSVLDALTWTKDQRQQDGGTLH